MGISNVGPYIKNSQSVYGLLNYIEMDKSSDVMTALNSK